MKRHSPTVPPVLCDSIWSCSVYTQANMNTQSPRFEPNWITLWTLGILPLFFPAQFIQTFPFRQAFSYFSIFFSYEECFLNNFVHTSMNYYYFFVTEMVRHTSRRAAWAPSTSLSPSWNGFPYFWCPCFLPTCSFPFKLDYLKNKSQK